MYLENRKAVSQYIWVTDKSKFRSSGRRLTGSSEESMGGGSIFANYTREKVAREMFAV